MFMTLILSVPLKAVYAANKASLTLFYSFIPHFIMIPRLSYHYKDGCPRKSGLRLHDFVDRSKTLTPTMDPTLGASVEHQELHRCAHWRIFSTVLSNGTLTRILHQPIT